MSFYLQHGIESGGKYERVFLDSHTHKDCEVIRVVEAETWLKARQDVSDIEHLVA